ncbi:MAG: arginine--tRNA ligase, partial [Thermoguttaceae bacterium]|nr:arginine--tRNA ligase [Thermoguttaceae bacterium]
MNILSVLKERFCVALNELVPHPEDYLDLIRPSQDARFGDYQANLAMPLGKAFGKPPREVAQTIIDRLRWQDMLEKPEIAGPGFINLKLRTDWLANQVQKAIADSRLGVLETLAPRTLIIDFSAPNVAKPMHVGHIRSTMIGNSLCKIHRFLGHRVTADNHIGDWGTQFGMIIYGFRNFVDQEAYKTKPVEELARLYRLVRQLVDYYAAEKTMGSLVKQLAELDAQITAQKNEVQRKKELADAGNGKEAVNEYKKSVKELDRLKTQKGALEEKQEESGRKIDAVEKDDRLFRMAKEHPEIGQEVLTETSRLHHGDEENRRLWREFLPFCIEDINRIYQRLGVVFDTTLGESFYNDRLGPLVDRLQREGIARESEGAVCIFLDGSDVPMLIRKKDGAFLYATTDLATLEYRRDTYHPDAILYVVDFRQSLHFEQLFAVAKKTGLATAELTHVKFGTVLGEDGRPFKTRSGETVGLESLLDESERRALAIVSANDDAKPAENRLTEEERREVARKVGIGALIYADLSQNRESDYVFSYDKMLAMNGNTATYMQYAYARIRSIFARGNVDADLFRKTVTDAIQKGQLLLSLTDPAERMLALELLKFSEALDSVVRDYRPNQLTSYLYELANRYSVFFERCPVLKAENDSLKTSRLLLCDLTARIIQKGLDLLGIQTV